jgi:hypothetical protein
VKKLKGFLQASNISLLVSSTLWELARISFSVSIKLFEGKSTSIRKLTTLGGGKARCHAQ